MFSNILVTPSVSIGGVQNHGIGMPRKNRNSRLGILSKGTHANRGIRKGFERVYPNTH